jgi:hypothetical protein
MVKIYDGLEASASAFNFVVTLCAATPQSSDANLG